MICMDQKAYIDLANNRHVASRDEELITGALAGSPDAFAELERLYSPQLYSTIFRITRNREDAEDVLQETFLRAYLRLRNFEGRSSVCSWLTRIAINTALMLLRKRRCRREAPFEQQQDSDPSGAYMDVRDDALDPEQLYDQRQRCQAIRRAIERLDPKSGVAIAIWVSEERSMKELARELGVSVASFKSRLYRARMRLRRSRTPRSSRQVNGSGYKGSDPAASSSLEL